MEICECVCVCLCVCVNACMLNMYVCMNKWACVCVYVYMYLWVRWCVCVCVCDWSIYQFLVIGHFINVYHECRHIQQHILWSSENALSRIINSVSTFFIRLTRRVLRLSQKNLTQEGTNCDQTWDTIISKLILPRFSYTYTHSLTNTYAHTHKCIQMHIHAHTLARVQTHTYTLILM